jgi:hypothetical protein
VPCQAPGLRGTPSPALWRAQIAPCSVTTGQLAARRLYEFLGFKTFSHEPRALLVGGKYVDEDYYVLLLR